MKLLDQITGGNDTHRDDASQQRGRFTRLTRKSAVVDPLDEGGSRKRDKPHKVNPRESNWQKVSNRDLTESRANRDIQGSQQLDRSSFKELRTSTAPKVLAIVAGASTALLAYIAIGLLMFMWATLIGPAFSDGGVSHNDETEAESFELSVEEAQSRYGIAPYYVMTKEPYGDYVTIDCARPLTATGDFADNKCYDSPEALSVPDWYAQKVQQAVANDPSMADKVAAAQEAQAAQQAQPKSKQADDTIIGYMFKHPTWWRLLLSFIVGLIVWGPSRTVFMRQLEAENMLDDVTDINQHDSDAHIQLPQEVANTYAAFPDVGAIANQGVSSMLGHGMLSNKGLKKVRMAKRAEEDIVDPDDGEILVYKGDVIRDDDGEIIWEEKEVDLVDNDFSHALFTSANVPDDKRLRRFFDPSKTEHNPNGRVREIEGKHDTLAEYINDDWELPWYEPQRPAGFYMIDVAPVNTMVLAMTRAGKGQTYIEPMIDMWTRERHKNNMVINDPKGELLVKNFVRMTMRGFQVVQFNLINSLKTDIYNPLGMAAESAREGDFTKCAMYVENIAEVFFPVDGADDPVWPNAANNAFKRTAYGLIDYYLEKERELRQRAVYEKWDPKVLDTRIDKMWGNVTLFNCYLFFVQLSAKKLPRPSIALENDYKAEKITEDEYNAKRETLNEEREKLWDGNDEIDMLTLFFNATDALPTNGMRNLVGNADKALRAMGGAEKMLASVYGIAITAMSFFTDPTISTLTSGTLSQNTDLGSLSFPRRFGVRFSQNYVSKYHLVGAQVKWDCYEDKHFTTRLEGSDYTHEDTLSREGWARAYFKGIFENDVTYLRLQVLHASTGNLMRTFYFKFTKAYQTNLRGRDYIKDPITDEKIVKNGVLVELQEKTLRDGSVVYVPDTTMFERDQLSLPSREELKNIGPEDITTVKGVQPAIMSTTVRYSEQPKAVFLVTPPHLMKYAKIILILLKQLVDLNFDKSYMTKSNQKPMYKTRFMLDELGNLQSEGNGISGFETMLSIGLGQEQQFTLILQTLQQLKDVYGDSVDKIVQGNAQPLHSLIATPDGWTTMGEVQPGTEVLVPDGGKAQVTGVYPRGERAVYEVVTDDGAVAEACEEHLWEVIVYE